MSDRYVEVNLDGMIGPSHHYAGLSFGNIASESHKGQVAHPKSAGLQSLEKCRLLHEITGHQLILPPLCTPQIHFLKEAGFTGELQALLERAYHEDLRLLSSVWSTSYMWTANLGIFTSSMDSKDHQHHLTCANLSSHLHRSFEAKPRTLQLRSLFKSLPMIIHHPLPSTRSLADEGAANHTRLSSNDLSKGLHFFVYGHNPELEDQGRPKKYPARQSKQAFEWIIRKHGLNPDVCIFAKQCPDAVDQGVFHNDVISVGHEDLFFYHEKSFVETDDVIEKLQTTFKRVTSQNLRLLKVSEEEVPVKDCVSSYLFNSQIVTDKEGRFHLICPLECRETKRVQQFLTKAQSQKDFPFYQIHYVDLRQSMNNGGGPACLRLRILLKEKEYHALPHSIRYSPELYETLKGWISKHYRDKLAMHDLKDLSFYEECQGAFIDLKKILGLHYEVRYGCNIDRKLH